MQKILLNILVWVLVFIPNLTLAHHEGQATPPPPVNVTPPVPSGLPVDPSSAGQTGLIVAIVVVVVVGVCLFLRKGKK